MKKLRSSAIACVVVCLASLALPSSANAEGKTRTYYIAVDEIEWNYMPMGIDCRHASRQRGHMDVSLPRQRAHGIRHDGNVRSSALGDAPPLRAFRRLVSPRYLCVKLQYLSACAQTPGALP